MWGYSQAVVIGQVLVVVTRRGALLCYDKESKTWVKLRLQAHCGA